MFDWPHKLLGCRLNESIAEQVIAEFNADLKAYQTVSAQENQPAFVKHVLNRSFFVRTAVKQFVHCFDELEWQTHGDAESIAVKRRRVLTQSQLVEDFFRGAKNDGQVKGARKCVRPERSMFAALKRGVLDSVHKFEKPPGIDTTKRTSSLPPTAFGRVSRQPGAQKRKREGCSIDLKGIASTSQATSWFSPVASNIGKPWADLPLLRQAASPDTSCLAKAFLGCVSDWSHQVLLRKPDGENQFDWHLCLHHWDTSGALAWPVALSFLPIPLPL